ncbi:hypothetical protein [Paludisphaera mucosa]|uniref:Uncharacterized protein n=1 Tax=Paludisphaera mucosa TaxID=3030827 RepID=A0ABT6F6C6_9BACT|nr:hypothetical protein [Paludisphaera mucosa]MDG3003143.1 hypothetical protein [Paludisphaera mucosa]
MDRQRPVVERVAFLALLLATSGVGRTQETPPPLENRPYRIAIHLASASAARLDAGRRDELVARWSEMVRRFVGPAWSVQLAETPSPLVGEGLERLKAEDLAGFDPSFDKAWLIWVDVDRDDDALVFSGREYDAATRWLGPLQRRQALSPMDAPRTFFLFTIDLFSPSALIVGQEGGRALLKVQGAAITAASELGAVVAKGTTFIPIRLVTTKEETVRITRIAFTYLAAESIEGSIARCAILSAFRDPLSQRISRPNTLAALGIKAGDSALHLRFVDKTTKAPAAGYTLTERPAPDGPVRNVGMTDRSGRILVEPGPTRSVVKLRLLAGDSEPLAEFPIMPGESVEEREIAVDPLPLASRYQVQLDALRDGIVDQVAMRGRLERLMQSRLEGEDWSGLQELLKQYERLPAPASFGDALKKLKEEATKLSYESTKTTVLTRHLQAQFDELQGLIDGYLGEDASLAFAEALSNKKKEQADAKAATKKKLEAPPLPPPGAEKSAEPKVEAQQKAPVRDADKPGAPRADTP